MSTTIVPSPAVPPVTDSEASVLRRSLGVVARPQTYRNVAYLLLGLPLGTLWFTVLVSGAATGISMLAVALLGIPILVGLWYAAGAFASVERVTASRLLDVQVPGSGMASGGHGNLWTRFRSMAGDRQRWREVGFLLARFPIGIATFTAAAVALTAPVMVAYAPFTARHDDEPFGDWALSSTMEDVATYPTWSWFLVPLGAGLLLGSLHLLNRLASVCGRFVVAGLGGGR